MCTKNCTAEKQDKQKPSPISLEISPTTKQ